MPHPHSLTFFSVVNSPQIGIGWKSSWTGGDDRSKAPHRGAVIDCAARPSAHADKEVSSVDDLVGLVTNRHNLHVL